MPKGTRGGQSKEPVSKERFERSLKKSDNSSYKDEDLSKSKTFEGLRPVRETNKYITMNRVSEDKKKIIVNVADSHLRSTPYGYALILDDNHVVYLKDFAVNKNYYGNEVLINKDYFKVVERKGYSDEFGENKKNLSYDTWLKTAKIQQRAKNEVKWEKHYKSAKTKAIMKNMSKG